jgi:hypothetical protein
MKTKHFRGFRPERRRSFPVFAIPIVVAIFALVMQPVVNYFDASFKELRVNTAAGNGTGPVVSGTQINHTPAKATIRQPHRGNADPGYGTDRSPDQRVPAASVSGTPILPSATK